MNKPKNERSLISDEYHQPVVDFYHGDADADCDLKFNLLIIVKLLALKTKMSKGWHDP